MKKFIEIILLLGLACIFPANPQIVFAENATIVTSLIIPKIEVVIDEKQNYALLRMAEVPDLGGQDFEYLAHQAENLSLFVGQRTRLSSGQELIFDGGKPFFVSFYKLSKEGKFIYLVFSNNIRIEKDVVNFKGENPPISR